MSPPDPAPFANLRAELPVVLLPVRIETRFGSRRAVASSGEEVDVPTLAVRVYPDDIGIDGHDDACTDAEVEAGRRFWQAADAAELAPDAAESDRLKWAGWQVFVGTVGTARAVHVANACRGGTDPTRRIGARPPTFARLLPHKWVITGWRDGRRIFAESSGPVRPNLAVTPKPRADGSLAFDPSSGALFDEDSLWVTDLNAAVSAGMAVIIDLLTPDDSASGMQPARRIDRLFVFGINEPAASDGTGVGDLTGLLASHGATGSAGFEGNGTPTNNFGDGRSVWSQTPDEVDLYNRVMGPQGTNVAEAVGKARTAAGAMAMALGVPVGTFGTFGGAGIQDRFLARSMTQAIYPVIWGELFGSLLCPTDVEFPTDIPKLNKLDEIGSFALSHIRDHVRGGGPLPTLRVGRQPYGVLPITKSDMFRAQPSEPRMVVQLRDMLNRLLPFWKRSVHSVATLTPSAQAGPTELDSAGRHLLEVLGLGPVPHPGAYMIRSVDGPIESSVRSATSRPGRFLDIPADQAMPTSVLDQVIKTASRHLVRDLFSLVPGDIRESRLSMMETGDAQLMRMKVAADDPNREGAATVADYLTVLGAPPTPFRVAPPWGDAPPTDLLFQLLDRSLQLAHEQSALAMLRVMGSKTGFEGWAVSPELTALGIRKAGDAASPTATEIVGMSVGLVAGGQAVSADVASLTVGELTSQASAMSSFFDANVLRRDLPELFLTTKAAVAELASAQLGAEVYTRLLGEALAVATTRLDAWFTSLATSRLATLRAANPLGAGVGHFGWVTDLVRDDTVIAAVNIANDPDLPPGWEPGPEVVAVVEPDARVGWVHTPSVDQAITGAVLRGGELAHQSGDTQLARMDLTSDRVRAGSWIVSAVQRGQPLGAVLGYRLERSFHDLSDIGAGVNLHRFVDDLRRRHPQRSVPLADGLEQVVPHEVVDGVQSWKAWREGTLAFDEAPNAAENAVIDGIFVSLDAAVDSVADLLVAEGVHQLAGGRPLRAAATFEAVATGGPPPDGMDVLRTPRQGVSITHRIVVPCPDPDAVATGWNSGAARARIAPAAEAFARRWLGDATDWIMPGPNGDRDLGSLGVCALDVVVEGNVIGDEVPILARRLVAHTGGATSAVNQNAPEWRRLSAIAATVAEALNRSRPLVPVDVSPPNQVYSAATTEAPPPPTLTMDQLIDLEASVSGHIQLTDMALAALAGSITLVQDIEFDPTAPPPAPIVDIGAARAALSTLAGLGYGIAVLGNDAIDDDVIATVHAVFASLSAGLREALAAVPVVDQTPEGLLRGMQTAMSALLGTSVVCVPTLDDLGSLASSRVAAVTSFDVEDWMDAVARVRPGLATLGDLRLFRDAHSGAASSADLSVCQMPSRDGESWLGGPLATQVDPQNPTQAWRVPIGPTVHAAIIALDDGPLDATCGLVLDEWSEVIPSATATTGLSVFYDAPDARAPQAVLVAVHPDPAGGDGWSWELIEGMLDETLDLADIRLVDLDDLAVTAIDEYLPLTYIREGLKDVRSLFDLIGTVFAEKQWNAAALLANKGGGA